MTATKIPERVNAEAMVSVMRQAMAEGAADPDRARREMDELAIPPDPATCAVTCAAPAIPPRFRNARLTEFREGLKDFADASSQLVAFHAVTDWCKRVTSGEPAMLALVGATGVGKSHLLYAAVHALYRRNVRVYAQPWYRLADALRYGGRSAWTGKLIESAEVRDEIMGERVICLDDVRPTSGTAFDDTELAKIILDAWDRESAMLITTNCSPLTAVLSPPLASRFVQVVMTGADRRHA